MKNKGALRQGRKFLREKGSASLLVFAIIAILYTNLHIYLGVKHTENSTRIIIDSHRMLNLTDQLLSLIQNAHTGQQGYLLTNEAVFLETFKQALSQKKSIFAELRVLSGDNANTEKLQNEVSGYINYLERTLESSQVKGREKKSEVVRLSEGRINFDNIRSAILSFQQTETRYLEAREKAFRQSKQNLLLLSYFINAIITGIVILALVQLINAAKFRNSLFTKLDKSNRTYLLDKGEGDLNEEDQVVGKIIENLKNATSFIRQIGQGNYKVEIADMLGHEHRENNKGNLAGALIDMRDQMKVVAENERIRNWTNTGLTEFANIIRLNSRNVHDLTIVLITKLVNYLGANQGAIFLVNDDDKQDVYLSLAATYAYNRKKYLEKKIYPNEGLVGQAYIEKEKLFITDIPQNYTTITSGLGDATPNCILIQPLMVNGEIFGIMELASFHVFEPYKQAFTEKVSESIAATISSLKINDRTRFLLEQSQLQAEEMRAQEEEMRQSIEEMQATQEHQDRLKKEMVDKEQASIRREKELLEEINRLQQEV